MRAAARLIVLFAAFAANACRADDVEARRFEISGSGTIAVDALVAANGGLRIDARLSPQTQSKSAAMAQSTGRFVLSGTLAAVATVCYADTIFRDDFDADGF